MPRVSPITPIWFYGSDSYVTPRHAWLQNRHARTSVYNCFGSSSISNEIVVQPSSIRTETEGFSTEFLGTPKWRDLSSLTPLIHFPDPLPVYCLPFPSPNETHRWASVDDSNFRSGISTRASFAFRL